MRPCSSLVTRVAVLGALGLTAIAVLLGRLSPREGDGRARPGHGRWAFGGRAPATFDRRLDLTDVETGAIRRERLPASDVVTLLLYSPRRDAAGRAPVIAAWSG